MDSPHAESRRSSGGGSRGAKRLAAREW